MGAVRLPKTLVLTIDGVVPAQGRRRSGLGQGRGVSIHHPVQHRRGRAHGLERRERGPSYSHYYDLGLICKHPPRLE